MGLMTPKQYLNDLVVGAADPYADEYAAAQMPADYAPQPVSDPYAAGPDTYIPGSSYSPQPVAPAPAPNPAPGMLEGDPSAVDAYQTAPTPIPNDPTATPYYTETAPLPTDYQDRAQPAVRQGAVAAAVVSPTNMAAPGGDTRGQEYAYGTGSGRGVLPQHTQTLGALPFPLDQSAPTHYRGDLGVGNTLVGGYRTPPADTMGLSPFNPAFTGAMQGAPTTTAVRLSDQQPQVAQDTGWPSFLPAPAAAADTFVTDPSRSAGMRPQQPVSDPYADFALGAGMLEGDPAAIAANQIQSGHGPLSLSQSSGGFGGFGDLARGLLDQAAAAAPQQSPQERADISRGLHGPAADYDQIGAGLHSLIFGAQGDPSVTYQYDEDPYAPRVATSWPVPGSTLASQDALHGTQPIITRRQPIPVDDYIPGATLTPEDSANLPTPIVNPSGNIIDYRQKSNPAPNPTRAPGAPASAQAKPIVTPPGSGSLTGAMQPKQVLQPDFTFGDIPSPDFLNTHNPDEPIQQMRVISPDGTSWMVDAYVPPDTYFALQQQGWGVAKLTDDDLKALRDAGLVDKQGSFGLKGKTALVPPDWVAVLGGEGVLPTGNLNVPSVEAASSSVATGSTSGGGGGSSGGSGWRDYGGGGSSGGRRWRSYGGGGGGGGYDYDSGYGGGGGGGGFDFGPGFPFADREAMADAFEGEGHGGVWDNPIFARYFDVLSKHYGPARARVMMRGFSQRYKGKRGKSARSKRGAAQPTSALTSPAGVMPTQESIRGVVDERLGRA